LGSGVDGLGGDRAKHEVGRERLAEQCVELVEHRLELGVVDKEIVELAQPLDVDLPLEGNDIVCTAHFFFNLAKKKKKKHTDVVVVVVALPGGLLHAPVAKGLLLVDLLVKDDLLLL